MYVFCKNGICGVTRALTGATIMTLGNWYFILRTLTCVYIRMCTYMYVHVGLYVYVYEWFLGYLRTTISFKCGPGSSVGIATDYGLDGPGILSQWERDFSPVQTGPGAHPASRTMGTGSFSGVKCGWGVLLTTHPLLAPRSWKSRELCLYPPSGPQPGM